MHKRKLSGIIKYGKRIKRHKKFQAGGSISVTTGEYDWRDDPYEKQLAAERLQQQKINAKAATSSSGGSFDSTFTPLKGGLEGTRKQFAAEFTQKQNSYLAQVQANGTEWAKNPSGQAAYQSVLDFGAEKQELLTTEGKIFDKLNKDSKENMGALAISGGDMFVAIAQPSGGVDDTGNSRMRTMFKEITVEQYTTNQSLKTGDPKKMLIKPVKLSTFIDWKRKNYSAESVHLLKKYLGEGAESMEEFYKKNAAPLLKSAEITIDTSNERLNGSGNMTMNLSSLKGSIDGMLKGTSDGSGVSFISKVTSSNNASVMKVVNHIFSAALSEGSSYDTKRLRSTLQSEVLADVAVEKDLEGIRAKGGSTEEINREIESYMDARMKIALVNRLIFARKTKTKTATGQTGEHKIKGDLDGITSSMASWIFNGDGDNKMEFEIRDKDGKRKSEYVTAGVSNALKPTVLKLDTEPLLSHNVAVNDSFNTGRIYLEDGTEITGPKGLFGDMDVSGNSIESKLILKGGKGVDIVYVPEVDGKPNVHYFNQPRFTDVKDKMKQSYIDYMRDNGLLKGDLKGAKIADLTKMNSSKPKAYREYVKFINMGKKLDVYKQIAATATGDRAVRAAKDLEMATKSADLLVTLGSELKAAFQGQQVVLKPYGYLSLLVNDDEGHDIEDKIQKSLPGVDLSVSSSDKERMAKVQTDHGQGDHGNLMPQHWLPDSNVRFSALVKVTGALGRNGASGNNGREQKLMNEVENKIGSFVNSGSLTSNLTTETIAGFFI